MLGLLLCVFVQRLMNAKATHVITTENALTLAMASFVAVWKGLLAISVKQVFQY